MRAYCAFEDRPKGLTGVKLLALSMERHCRDFTLYVGATKEQPEFSEWLKRHAPHAVPVILPPLEGPKIKQIKPAFFLHLFERGVTDLTWLDTDLLVLRDVEPLLAPLDDETILVTQDMDYAFKFNQRLLDHYHLKPARRLDHTVNTCVLRGTIQHRPIFEKCLEFLQDPFFLEQQAKPYYERIEGFGYEQKIFELLLCSRGDFALPEYPLRFVPEGSGIVQELGVTTYGLRDRLWNGLGWQRPWFIHLPGIKSWDPDPTKKSYRGSCVFSAFAETYREELEEPVTWANSSGLTSKIARFLSFGQPHWVGWGHCLVGKIVRLLKTGTMKRKA